MRQLINAFTTDSKDQNAEQRTQGSARPATAPRDPAALRAAPGRAGRRAVPTARSFSGLNVICAVAAVVAAVPWPGPPRSSAGRRTARHTTAAGLRGDGGDADILRFVLSRAVTHSDPLRLTHTNTPAGRRGAKERSQTRQICDKVAWPRGGAGRASSSAAVGPASGANDCKGWPWGRPGRCRYGIARYRRIREPQPHREGMRATATAPRPAPHSGSFLRRAAHMLAPCAPTARAAVPARENEPR